MHQKFEHSPRLHGKIGIVVPARNEAANLEKCLRSLKPFQDTGDIICVVNAQSSDETAACAQAHGVEILESKQASRSEAIRSGVEWLLRRHPALEVLMIAHADMLFQDNTRAAVTQFLQDNPNAQWGALGHRIDHAGAVYRWLEWGNAFRVRCWSLAYGDQCQLMRTSALASIGGFPCVDCLEDVELSLRLRTLGPACDLGCPVLIPNRHWRGGVVLTTARNWLTVILYRIKRSLTGTRTQG
ncbi:MAG: glycosyltransferase [Candidatus Hinthialibacter antarcticus]|nr:glycosyltransferase [Candidatus Hinthialibacter antarcticus]